MLDGTKSLKGMKIKRGKLYHKRQQYGKRLSVTSEEKVAQEAEMGKTEVPVVNG